MNENTESYISTVNEEIETLWTEEEQAEDGKQTAGQGEVQKEEAEFWGEEETHAQKAAQEQENRQDGEERADQPELFTLKNRDEKRQVSRDELIAMAQKGWDYDHIREERDQLRQYRSEADPAYELVKSYAQRNGMTVSDYLDYCRKQELMSRGIDEPTASAQLAIEREKQNAQKKDMDTFLAIYPNIKAEEIPKEVWRQVAQGRSLVAAYAMHQNQKLTTELAALKKNNENAARTTGSLSSPASGDKKDEIDQWWYADE